MYHRGQDQQGPGQYGGNIIGYYNAGDAQQVQQQQQPHQQSQPGYGGQNPQNPYGYHQPGSDTVSQPLSGATTPAATGAGYGCQQGYQQEQGQQYPQGQQCAPPGEQAQQSTQQHYSTAQNAQNQSYNQYAQTGQQQPSPQDVQQQQASTPQQQSQTAAISSPQQQQYELELRQYEEQMRIYREQQEEYERYMRQQDQQNFVPQPVQELSAREEVTEPEQELSAREEEGRGNVAQNNESHDKYGQQITGAQNSDVGGLGIVDGATAPLTVPLAGVAAANNNTSPSSRNFTGPAVAIAKAPSTNVSPSNSKEISAPETDLKRAKKRKKRVAASLPRGLSNKEFLLAGFKGSGATDSPSTAQTTDAQTIDDVVALYTFPTIYPKEEYLKIPTNYDWNVDKFKLVRKWERQVRREPKSVRRERRGRSLAISVGSEKGEGAGGRLGRKSKKRSHTSQAFSHTSSHKHSARSRAMSGSAGSAGSDGGFTGPGTDSYNSDDSDGHNYHSDAYLSDVTHSDDYLSHKEDDHDSLGDFSNTGNSATFGGSSGTGFGDIFSAFKKKRRRSEKERKSLRKSRRSRRTVSGDGDTAEALALKRKGFTFGRRSRLDGEDEKNEKREGGSKGSSKESLNEDANEDEESESENEETPPFDETYFENDVEGQGILAMDLGDICQMLNRDARINAGLSESLTRVTTATDSLQAENERLEAELLELTERNRELSSKKVWTNQVAKYEKKKMKRMRGVILGKVLGEVEGVNKNEAGMGNTGNTDNTTLSPSTNLRLTDATGVSSGFGNLSLFTIPSEKTSELALHVFEIIRKLEKEQRKLEQEQMTSNSADESRISANTREKLASLRGVLEKLRMLRRQDAHEETVKGRSSGNGSSFQNEKQLATNPPSNNRLALSAEILERITNYIDAIVEEVVCAEREKPGRKWSDEYATATDESLPQKTEDPIKSPRSPSRSPAPSSADRVDSIVLDSTALLKTLWISLKEELLLMSSIVSAEGNLTSRKTSATVPYPTNSTAKRDSSEQRRRRAVESRRVMVVGSASVQEDSWDTD